MVFQIYSRASHDGVTSLLRIQVSVHQSINNSWQLCLHQGFAGGFKVRQAGFKFPSTSPSIIAGSCASTRALQVASKSGRMDPTAVQICSTNSTISCSVVSLVIKLSISVTTSTQMEQVRSFLGAERVLASRQERRARTAFIVQRAH